jgi:hypothetical protein
MADSDCLTWPPNVTQVLDLSQLEAKDIGTVWQAWKFQKLKKDLFVEYVSADRCKGHAFMVLKHRHHRDSVHNLLEKVHFQVFYKAIKNSLEKSELTSQHAVIDEVQSLPA